MIKKIIKDLLKSLRNNKGENNMYMVLHNIEKDDTTQNGSQTQKSVSKETEREQKLVPLKLTDRTTILVKPKNCNEEYRKKAIERLGL